MQFKQATTPEELDTVRSLFREYADSLQVDLCFQGFEAELAALPGSYGRPDGCLLLAYRKQKLVGCVALRKIGEGVCEMKRLFVRDQFRGLGLGRRMVNEIVREAKAIGYDKMRLDTLPPMMNQAIALYRSLGFKEVEPYYHNPVPGALFMELNL